MVTQCKKRLNTTDYGLITKHLLAVMGPGKRSAVGRWTRAHRSLAPEVVSELKRLKRVPDAVVLDNPWLMGDGPKAKQRLTGVYAVKALLLWERAQEEQRPFTADTFQKEVCALASAFHYRCKENIPQPCFWPSASVEVSRSCSNRRRPATYLLVAQILTLPLRNDSANCGFEFGLRMADSGLRRCPMCQLVTLITCSKLRAEKTIGQGKAKRSPPIFVHV